MSTLDLLIRRIKAMVTVSNEDAVDTVKQYWDEAVDTVKSYWGDVDEAIVTETGIAPTSLAQLLDNHRQAHSYANTGGNSGVASYDLGEDWFLVNFTTGSRYLYTTKSATREQLDEMKRYANEGKGLNSYIMRILKTNYAGRNVKGEILIKPGMEHYSRQVVKRIELLEAYRNTMSQEKAIVVSQEGIGDMISKLGRLITGKDEHGVRKTDKKPGSKVKDHEKAFTAEGMKQYEELKSALTKYYLNDNWLNHQKFVEGSVDAKDFSSILCFNGKVGNDALANVNKGLQYRAAFAAKWRPILQNTADKANAIFDQLEAKTKGAEGADAKAIAIVEEGIKQLERIPDPMAKLPKPQGSGLGNLIPVVKTHENFKYLGVAVAGKPESVDKLPALNKAQIKEAANLILKVLDWRNGMEYIAWPDFGDGTDFIEWIYEADNAVYMQLYDRFSQQGCDQLWVEDVNRLVNCRAVASALERWIDRSIQGEASTENYGGKMLVLKKYKSQLDTAGADGLDPVARQFMKVGLESHGCTVTVSNERHSDQLSETQALRKLVERELSNATVSNEGVWGAIKYLFGGNYEDLPKINAAYDEAVEAVKSTYGNPDWVNKRRLNTGKRVNVKGFSKVAENPHVMYEKVKQTNAPSLEETRQYVKEEVEYLSKFAKALSNGDPDKIKALLDMFEIRPKRQLVQAPDVDLGSPGDIKALSAQDMLKVAETFAEAVKYRRETDVVFSSGLYKLLYTDSGKPRYGINGTETTRYDGAAKDLAIAIGKAGDNVQESFYQSFTPAWDNIDGVVRGTLMILEASAK